MAETKISLMYFWIIMIVVLFLSTFMGYAANRWMMNYDPNKTGMYIGIGALVGLIIDIIVWYFIREKVEWNSTTSTRMRPLPPPQINERNMAFNNMLN